MKIYNEELQRLQAAMMEETRLEAKLAELMCCRTYVSAERTGEKNK